MAFLFFFTGLLATLCIWYCKLTVSLSDRAEGPARGFVVEPSFADVEFMWYSGTGDVGDAGGVFLGLMGLEKLIEPLLSSLTSSGMLEFRIADCLFGLAVLTPGPLSRLTPRPPDSLGGGELTRWAGSTLAGRLSDLAGTGGGDAYALGSGGIGGGSSPVGRFDGTRLGEGSRKVLSVMEPELLWRERPPGLRPLPLALPCDDVELCLCSMRLVWIWLTGTGDVV